MDHEHDLTTGSIMGKLSHFFFPILLGMLFFQLYNTVDAVVVGTGIGGMMAAMILAEQVTTISKHQLRNYVGKIADADFLNRIDHALSAQLGMVEIDHADNGDNENHGET